MSWPAPLRPPSRKPIDKEDEEEGKEVVVAVAVAAAAVERVRVGVEIVVEASKVDGKCETFTELVLGLF